MRRNQKKYDFQFASKQRKKRTVHKQQTQKSIFDETFQSLDSFETILQNLENQQKLESQLEADATETAAQTSNKDKKDSSKKDKKKPKQSAATQKLSNENQTDENESNLKDDNQRYDLSDPNQHYKNVLSHMDKLQQKLPPDREMQEETEKYLTQMHERHKNDKESRNEVWN